jgi:hypothetical protein
VEVTASYPSTQPRVIRFTTAGRSGPPSSRVSDPGVTRRGRVTTTVSRHTPNQATAKAAATPHRMGAQGARSRARSIAPNRRRVGPAPGASLGLPLPLIYSQSGLGLGDVLSSETVGSRS